MNEPDLLKLEQQLAVVVHPVAEPLEKYNSQEIQNPQEFHNAQETHNAQEIHASQEKYNPQGSHNSLENHSSQEKYDLQGNHSTQEADNPLENHTPQEKATPPERYNPQNWQIVELGSPCQLEGCKYLTENGTSRRMHRHCLQLTATGSRCTYNTERTSNLPGHDRVHSKGGDPEKEDVSTVIQTVIQANDVVRIKKAPKRKAEKALSDSQQTAFADVGASVEQMADLLRKGIQYVEDCRLYRPKEVKDCLLGVPPEERRETEARQLLVRIDSYLRKSGCSIGDLDLGFSET